MDARARFLAEMAAELPLPDEARAEVLEELAAHLDDAITDLLARGYDPGEAEAEAIARLGPPPLLARELSRAHQAPAHLLAAAGAGTWAALRDGALGTVLGWAILTLAVVAGMAASRIVGGWLRLDINVSWDSGWNTVLTTLGLHAGALFAGAAAVHATARSAWRSPGEVRTAVTLVGGLGIAWIILVMLQQPLNWASVIALSLVPISFGVGARFERVKRPRIRMIAIALVVIGVIGFGAAIVARTMVGGWEATSYSWSTVTHGYEMIGPWWQDPASTQPLAFAAGSSGSAPGVLTLTVEAASPEVAARFHGLRLEAWRAEPPGDGWRLVPGQHAPFASADATVDGTAISGLLRIKAPNVSWAQVVLTGIGPNGTRYLLEASDPERVEFSGSVWDWIGALISG